MARKKTQTSSTATENGQKLGNWTDAADRVAKNAEHLAAMEEGAKKATRQVKPIVLPELAIEVLEIPLIGDAELICHAWSEKAKRQILDKQMGEASAGREPKDPVADFLASLYVIEPGTVQGDTSLRKRGPGNHPTVMLKGGRFGFPAIGFKNAAVTACTSLAGTVTKVAARQAFHVVGELVEIIGQPRMREDMVGLKGTADIRYRAGFINWRTTVTVRYNARLLSAAQIVNLFNTAGFAVGVGEWRSEKDGVMGLFHVAAAGE